MEPNYYPPVGFYFAVTFKDRSDTLDSQFQSVSGLSVDIETEEYAEGGENRFKHKLPVRTKYPNLVLKRGLLIDSELIKWCRKAIENFEFEPQNLLVSLYDDSKNPLMTWSLEGCFPVKWVVDDLNAMEGKIVVETIELAYKYFTIIKGKE